MTQQISNNKVLSENPELYREQNLKNLEQGRKTQKEKGVGIGDPIKQRLKSLQRTRIVNMYGKDYSIDEESRLHLCETTLEYYLRYWPKST